MSEDVPFNNPIAANRLMSHDELMQGVAAEEPTGVLCGLPYNSGLYISAEDLETFLQGHLANMLAERDIYDVAYRVVCFVERFGIKTTKSWQKDNEAIALGKTLEYIPNEQLQQFLAGQVQGEAVEQETIERIAHFTQAAIQKSAAHPRHTWPEPTWVFKTSTRLYITQAKTPEEAYSKVKEQYPNEREELQLTHAGGVLAPDQVSSCPIATDRLIT